MGETVWKTFLLLLFLAGCAFIAWGWIRLLLHNPAKPNERKPRRGGGGGHDEPTPDTDPNNRASLPVPQPGQTWDWLNQSDGTPALRLDTPIITREEWQRSERAWYGMGDETSKPAAPAEIPVEVTREFEALPHRQK